jgi:hypothetical protein
MKRKDLAQLINALTEPKMDRNNLRVLLNRWAEAYATAETAEEKREALVTYLEFLQIIAAGEGGPLSMLEAGTDGPLDPKLFISAYPDAKFPYFLNLRPVAELQEALIGLNNQENPSLFDRTRRPGKTTSRDKLHHWVRAAAVITILIGLGKSEKDASAMVAEAMRKRNLPLPGKPTTATPAWKLLQTWRDKCMSGEKGDLAAYWYRLGVGIGACGLTADELVRRDTTWNTKPTGNYAIQGSPRPRPR